MRRLDRILLGTALLSIALLAAVAGYFEEFAAFPPYDDEGYLMLAVRHLLDGHRLYDEIRVFYGPLYFLEKWLVHGPLGLPLTHDVVRLTALSFRLATAAVAAWVVGWMTRSVVVGAGAFLVVMEYMIPAVNEPGHPQELVALLLVALLLAARPRCVHRPARAVAGLGLLVAGILMVKVNVGGLAGIGVGMALLSSMKATRAVTWLRIGALAAVVLLPWILMRGSVDQPSFTRLAWLMSSWIIAAAAASFHDHGGEIRAVHLLGFAATCVAGILACALFPVAMGSSMAAIFDCLALWPLRLVGYLGFPPQQYGWAWLAAGTGVAAAVLVLRPGVRRAGIGTAAMYLVIAGKALIGLDVVLRPYPAEIMNAVTPFAWLILLPDREGPRRWPQQFPRLVLVWLAVLQPLQVYPLAGSQVQCGTLAAMMCALVGLGDAAVSLASLLPAADRQAARTAVASLALGVTLLAGATDVTHWATIYRKRKVPLDLPGSTRVRASPATAAALQSLVATLRARCTTFVSVPGSNSLYFWTGQDPPTLDLVSHDMRALSAERVAAMGKALQDSPAPCLVRHPAPFKAPRDPRFEAATKGLFSRHRSFGAYTLWVRRPS